MREVSERQMWVWIAGEAAEERLSGWIQSVRVRSP